MINGNLVPGDRLESVISEILSPMDSSTRAVYVRYNPKRDWTDYERISRAAAAVGASAYDEQLSFGDTVTVIVAPPVDLPRPR